MKKMISTILLGAMPLLASAAANHDHNHDGQAPVQAQGQGAAPQQSPVPGQAAKQGQGMMDMPMMGKQGMDGMHGRQHDAAVGQPGDPAQVSSTIDITMDDSMRFTPGTMHVKAGQTVRFFLKNTGNMPHEMVIGSMAELKEHQKMMASLDSGDEIITAGGIYGEITNKKEDRFVVRIADNTKIEVGKGFIQSVVKKANAPQ